MGVHPQKQEGLSYIGVPVHLGLISGDQMIAIADLAERFGGDIRLTRQQNFIVTGVPNESVDEAVAELERIGFPLDINPVRGNSIACTGEPHCNFSVAETKTRLGRLIDSLEERFGDEIADLRLHLDGCPHACAQHWVGDLGFQGTTSRDEGGVRRQAYDIFVRGSLGPEPEIGKSLFRRVPTDELDAAVEGLIAGWLEQRQPGETFTAFSRRLSDDELGELAGREPAKRTAEGGGGGMSSIELFDELEAGELSIQFEGEEPQARARVGDRGVHAEPRDLHLVPDRQRRADRHGVRDRSRPCRVFSVDTGRLPDETLELADRLRDRYPGLQLELVEPDPAEIASMVGKHGVDLFKTSVDLRLLCCNLRKVRPLTKHLHSLDAWVTGLRRDQWASRTNIRKVEIDHDHGAIVKLNPLAEWTEEEVWDYVRERDVPYHSLYDRATPRSAARPCTRAIAPGEASRAGRWWWETNAPKECGIHCSIESGGLEHELHAILGERRSD